MLSFFVEMFQKYEGEKEKLFVKYEQQSKNKATQEEIYLVVHFKYKSHHFYIQFSGKKREEHSVWLRETMQGEGSKCRRRNKKEAAGTCL